MSPFPAFLLALAALALPAGPASAQRFAAPLNWPAAALNAQNEAGCDFAVPARAATWGAIKAQSNR